MSTIYRLKFSVRGFRATVETFDYAPHTDFRQTILYIAAEIKTFSQLSGKTSVFFPSRIDTAHPRIIGHAVYCQHVGCRSGIYGMGICVAA
jgi:hypothetical protein